MSLNHCIRMGPFSTMHIPSCLRMRLRDSYRDAPPFARDRSLALYLTAHLDLRRSSLLPMFCMPTLKYLAPPKIAVSALLARRRWGTPVALSPRSTEDHSLCLFRCALVTTLRPDNVLPSLLGRVFSLHALSISSTYDVPPNSKWKCIVKVKVHVEVHAGVHVGTRMRTFVFQQQVSRARTIFMIGSMQ